MQDLNFHSPGWGARLEALVNEGKLDLAEVPAVVAKRAKLDKPPPAPQAQAADVIQMAQRIGGLKRVPRTGWIARLEKSGTRVESVADHSFCIAALAMLLSPREDEGCALDRERLLGMAIVHDLAESIVGDIAPHQNIPEAQKHAMERDAMAEMQAEVSQHAGSANVFEERILSVWQEYEARESREAKLIKDLDRLEMCIQAFEYEEEGVDLEDFFRSVRGKILDEEVQQWFAALEAKRRQQQQQRV